MVWPAVIGGAFGLAGGLIQQSSARSAVGRQVADQERFYRNRYQWQMEDMRRAGLNPLLAYKQGAPSGPSGALAQSFNPAEGAMAGASSAVGMKTARLQQKILQEDHRVRQHDAILRDKQHNLTEQQANTAYEILQQQKMETQNQRVWYEWLNSPAGRRAREIYFWGRALNPALGGAGSAVDIYRSMNPVGRRGR